MKLNNELEFNEFINNDYALVDFYADWCGPCKMMAPLLDKLSKSRDDIKIAKVDVDKMQTLAQKYGVMSIPTLLLFKKSELIDKKIGYTALPILTNWIDENK